MKKSVLRIIVLSSLAIALLAMVTEVGADSGNNAPVYLTFAKADPDGNFVWDGTVSGDVNGNLQTVLLSARQSDRILHVEFDWVVDAGAYSFTARLKGTLDTETGKVAMNGTVIDGWLEGAQVHEEGQLVNVATSGFEGTIQIMPASAG